MCIDRCHAYTEWQGGKTIKLHVRIKKNDTFIHAIKDITNTRTQIFMVRQPSSSLNSTEKHSFSTDGKQIEREHCQEVGKKDSCILLCSQSPSPKMSPTSVMPPSCDVAAVSTGVALKKETAPRPETIPSHGASVRHTRLHTSSLFVGDQLRKLPRFMASSSLCVRGRKALTCKCSR